MKELINNIFDNHATAALNSFPSVYSKDDLISVISRIRLEINELELEPEVPVVTTAILSDAIREVISQFSRSLDRNDNDYIDTNSAEFSIEHNNTLVIDSIDINVDNITDSLESILEEVFHEALDVRIKI